MNSAIWIYPWDLLDEGIESTLVRISDAGIQGISVAVAYHTVRALCPHNPKRAVYHGEGGVVYFRPNPAHFMETPIKPVESNLLSDGDALDEILRGAGRVGVRVHAWTVLHHNTRLGMAHPECTIENAFGDRYPFGLCPANPQVREYTLGIVRSLVERDSLDTIELESLGYMGIDHSGHHAKAGLELDALRRFLLSICFCPWCTTRMESQGVDVKGVRVLVMCDLRGFFAGHFQPCGEDVQGALEAVLGRGNSSGILAARDEVVLTLMEELFWLIRKPQTLSIMVNGNPLSTGAAAAVTLSQAREWCDRFLVQAFHREAAKIGEMVTDVTVRRGSTPVAAGLQAVHPFVQSASELSERAQAAARSGAESLQFYHYGLMPLENLGWIANALASA